MPIVTEKQREARRRRIPLAQESQERSDDGFSIRGEGHLMHAFASRVMIHVNGKRERNVAA